MTRAVLRSLAILSLVFLLLPALPVVQAEDGEEKKEDKRNFAQRALSGIQLGEGVQANQVTIFPLVLEGAPEALGVIPSTKTEKLSIRESDKKTPRYAVDVMNGEADPVLLLGGTVFEGGKRDRLVQRDYILPPGQTITIRTMPAASTSDKRKEAIPFVTSNVLAPPYLQEQALYGANASLVPIFVTHFLEFRNEGDKRKSLIAINESTLLTQYCLVCHRTLAAFPQPKEQRTLVVGGISAVRGRIQSLVIFGNNELLRAWFEPMLKGHSFAAAAIELRAKKAKLPLPGDDDPEATLAAVKEESERLLERLMVAKYKKDELGEGELGEAFTFRTGGGSRGRVVGLDGKVVHLVVFPDDPFERQLYSRFLKVPDPATQSDPEREGITELARRASMPGRRLTEAEKRLLERLRKGLRQGSGNPPGALPPRTSGIPPRGGGVGPRR